MTSEPRDELDEFVADMMKDDEFRLSYEALKYHALDRVFRKNGIYFRRWQWWFPWNVTDWRMPRVFAGADEWCNDSACCVVPPFGCFVIFWRLGPLRTMPCKSDWDLMNDSERADYAPCGYLHGGRLNHLAHHHNFSGIVCIKAKRWLRSPWQHYTSEKEGTGSDI